MPVTSNLTIIVGLLFICLHSPIPGNAQQSGSTPYDSLWKQVRQLEDSEGKTRSALELVQTIYTLARSQNNDPQTIKAIIYEGSLNEQLDPDSDTAYIHLLERLTDSLGQPARSILYSLTAACYDQYYRKNHTRIIVRTNIEDGSTIAQPGDIPGQNSDISTWTSFDFHHKITALYDASLLQPALLKSTPVNQYNPILDTGNSRKLRPTLYDILANRAIQYYNERDAYNSQPTYEISDSIIFAPAAVFAGHHFQIPDSSVRIWKALLVYQDLLRFHSQDKRPDAYIDVDINRLAFARMYGAVDNRDLHYLKGLTRLVTRYGKDSTGTWALYELALYYAQKGAQYRAGESDTSTRWYLNKALALCDQAQRWPHTPGAINAKQLAQTHRAPQAFLTVEKVIIPAKPFLALAEYQNCPRIYFHLIRADSTVENVLKSGGFNTSSAGKLSLYPVIRTWSQTLPDPGDHQLHRAEIKIEALPIGQYALLISTSMQFGDESPSSYVLPLNVSYLSWVLTGERNGYVLNRETSQPIAGATVQLWKLRDGYQPEKSISDSNGHIKFDKERPAENGLRRIEIRTPTDSLFDNSIYSFTFSTKADPSKQATPEFHIYTDRAIYRPGQKLHFKAIGVIRDTSSKREVLYQGKDSIWFYLQKNYGQTIDSIPLRVDDYGAVQGEFTLPLYAGTGGFLIRTSEVNASGSFSIEEYKRPSFEVTFQPAEKTYQLGDTLKLKGMAKTYSGNPLIHAKVIWTVSRNARFRFFWGHMPSLPYSPNITLLTGTSYTSADGSFAVTIPLNPDQGISPSLNPVFNFTIQADVTDINAETHSGSTSMSAGYTSLLLKMDWPVTDRIFSDSLHSIAISGTNLNNVPQIVHTTLQIYRLQPPSMMLRARYWTPPDEYTMTETEFHKWFPHDQYKQETNHENWPLGAKVLEDTFTTGRGLTYSMDKMRLQTGVYKILVSAKDSKGKKVETGGYLEVLNPGDGKLPYPTYHWTIVDKRKEADSATYYLASSFSNLYLIRQVSQPGITHFHHKRLPAGGRIETLHYAIAPEQDGPYEVSHGFVADNRFYTDLEPIPAKGAAQRLHIHYTTFSNKLEPGSQVTWTVRIDDPYKQPAQAEVLASMYDASLDQFTSGNWTYPNIRSYPAHGGIHWGHGGFADIRSSQLTYHPTNTYIYVPKRYDDLLSVGGYGNNLLQRRIMSTGVQVTANGQPFYGQESQMFIRGLSTTNAPPGMARLDEVVTIGYGTQRVNKDTLEYEVKTRSQKTAPEASLRSDFRETAFFYPELHTDAQGNVSFTFTAPESLTRWKLQTLAYTKDLRFGLNTNIAWTQKQLMVQPNLPRFLTEGDLWDLRTKISSLDSLTLNGTFTYGLFDATQPLLTAIVNGGSSSLWLSPYADTSTVNSIHIPLGYTHPMKYIVRADAGDYSDGEQGILPVLPLRILVTESIPFVLNAHSVQHLSVPALLNTARTNSAGTNSAGTNSAFTHSAGPGPKAGPSPFRLTLECASNPSWYAVQALPTLDITHADCTDQIFQQYYASAMGEYIVSSHPAIAGAIQTWIKDTAATPLASLHKNPELTSVTLQETPWVLQGGGQSGALGRLGLFLDPQHLSATQTSALQLLSSYQTEDGGFPWTKGGNADRATTQYILSGLGKLQALHALRLKDSMLAENIIAKGLSWMDKDLKVQYQKDTTYKLTTCDPLNVQYLYARSWFLKHPVDSSLQMVLDYYLGLAKSGWVRMNKYQQGMLALAFSRFGDQQTAQKIIASLKETSILDPVKGRYWKDNIAGWNWYESPITTQSQLIETFTALGEAPPWINQCKTWLLLQKQTQDWSGSRNTADACYALLMEGSDWTAPNPNIQISLGDTAVATVSDTPTGYLKRQWEGNAIQPGMGSVSLSMNTQASAETASHGKDFPIAWGAVYYQYFQDINQVQASETPDLKIEKQLFKTSPDGNTMSPVKQGDSLHVGDKVRIRFIIHSQRDLDYVHLKDGRAACLEPVDVLAQQKYQGGLTYYQSTGDLSTQFYFEHLPTGTSVLEYDLVVNQTGTFSGGIASIQCLYAPEFISHTQGVQLKAVE
jgi:hypothetical protein